MDFGSCIIKTLKGATQKRRNKMNTAILKYAVAIFSGDEEKIMGVFDTKAEADAFGRSNLVPVERGIQLCYSSLFLGDTPTGNSMSIYNYYNRCF